VRIEQENGLKIKLTIENGGHLPKLDGKRAQEHLVKLGRIRKIWFLLSPKSLAKLEDWPRFWLLKNNTYYSEMFGPMELKGLILIFLI